VLWLVTECTSASRFRTVTVAPGVTSSRSGLNAMPWMVMTFDEDGGFAAGVPPGVPAGVVDSPPFDDPPPQAASATASSAPHPILLRI
jgi:hypothetical protein